jgi:hypothetical protein
MMCIEGYVQQKCIHSQLWKLFAILAVVTCAVQRSYEHAVYC